MTNELILEIGKSYRDKKSNEYVVTAYNSFIKEGTESVITINKGTGELRLFNIRGKYYDNRENSEYDIIMEAPVKKKLKGYLAIWKDGALSRWSHEMFTTDRYTAIIDLCQYNIEYEEGEGL